MNVHKLARLIIASAPASASYWQALQNYQMVPVNLLLPGFDQITSCLGAMNLLRTMNMCDKREEQ